MRLLYALVAAADAAILSRPKSQSLDVGIAGFTERTETTYALPGAVGRFRRRLSISLSVVATDTTGKSGGGSWPGWNVRVLL